MVQHELEDTEDELFVAIHNDFFRFFEKMSETVQGDTAEQHFSVRSVQQYFGKIGKIIMLKHSENVFSRFAEFFKLSFLDLNLERALELITEGIEEDLARMNRPTSLAALNSYLEKTVVGYI